MKAALLFGPSDLRVVEIKTPALAADEALVRVVCYAPYGTDLGVFLNRGGRYPQPYPVGMGADFSGVIAEVGADVDGFAPGDRVSALTLAHCGTCANCLTGRTNLCLHPNYMPPPRQVCCQEFTVVPARKLAKLPDAVTFEDAAMLAGVGDALNAWDAIKPGVDETVAVVGVGAMGWGAIAAVKARRRRVIAVGGTGRRAGLARLAGADEVVPLAVHDEDVSDQVTALTPGGVSCVIETSATDWGVRQSFAIAAPGARIALTGGDALPVSAWDLVVKEIAVFGMRASHHQDQALQLIADGRIDLKPTVSHRMSLGQAPDAFALLTGPGAKDMGRVIIEISDP